MVLVKILCFNETNYIMNKSKSDAAIRIEVKYIGMSTYEIVFEHYNGDEELTETSFLLPSGDSLIYEQILEVPCSGNLEVEMWVRPARARVMWDKLQNYIITLKKPSWH